MTPCHDCFGTGGSLYTRSFPIKGGKNAPEADRAGAREEFASPIRAAARVERVA